jgi:hypothetical protein
MIKYVNELELGKWTPLEEKWLKKVKQSLKQAETNNIKTHLIGTVLG